MVQLGDSELKLTRIGLESSDDALIVEFELQLNAEENELDLTDMTVTAVLLPFRTYAVVGSRFAAPSRGV